MTKYWIKLYHEVLDDPKMGRLPDRYYRRVIELFLLAGEVNQGGTLPNITDMAWRLRLDPGELETELQAIGQTGIVHLNGDGNWHVTKFAERQDADTGAERVKRYREAQRKETQFVTNDVTNSYKSSNEHVTITVQDIDIDIDKELDTSSRPNIFTLYEQTIGFMTPIIRDELLDAEKEYPADWIEDAFRETARQNKHNWKYTAAILKSWKDNGGKRTGTKAEQPAKEPYATETWG